MLGDLRSFEWYYLAHLCDPAPIRLRGHQKPVNCVAFRPDGNRVVSGGAEGTVRVWDLSGRQAPRVFRCAGGVVWARSSVTRRSSGTCMATRPHEEQLPR